MAALERNEAALQSEQAASPQLGFLMVTRFAGGADSGEGPTAAARFKGVTWYRAETEYEAKAQVKDMTAGVTYSFAWIPPLEPVSDWGKDGLAMFADVSKMRFQRLGFAQLGGFKVTRSYPANLGEKAQKWATGLRFFVLKPPPTVSYRGVRGGTETESLTLSQRTVIDGTVTAIMIGGDPIVPVIAADADTASFFRADAALGLDHSGVVKERNIDDVRWLLPDQIEMVNGPYRQFADYAKKNPDWRDARASRSPRSSAIPTRWSGIASRASGGRSGSGERHRVRVRRFRASVPAGGRRGSTRSRALRRRRGTGWRRPGASGGRACGSGGRCT